MGSYIKRHFCPFKLIREYISLRSSTYKSSNEPFFVFSDGTPMTADRARTLLRKLLSHVNLQAQLYDIVR